MLKSLGKYLVVGERLLAAGLQLLPLTPEVLAESHGLRSQWGLLVNDSLLVASAIQHKIGHLATADKDFLGVDGLKVYLPTDLQKVNGA